jgi:Flp pilus assembly pilin Flp
MTRKRDIIGCLVRDERGTSTIEATLVLLVVAICCAGVLFQFKSLDSTLTAAEAARRDALQMSGRINGAPANDGRKQVIATPAPRDGRAVAS